MDDNERRGNAWDYALHNEGTRVVFERRADRLRTLTRIRDFSCFAGPVCVAYLYSSELFEPLKKYQHYALGLLALFAVLQTLLTLWSLIARWDEELAFNIRAAANAYLLKDAWGRLGQGQAVDLAIEYDLLGARQIMEDSHNTQKGITRGEMKRGMRAGLIAFQRRCICGDLPKGYGIPLWPKKSCVVCGGN